MRVTKADLDQRYSLLSLMCPGPDFDNWFYAQPRPKPEAGNENLNKNAAVSDQEKHARRSTTARHPIGTSHYAVTVPAEWKRPAAYWRTAT